MEANRGRLSCDLATVTRLLISLFCVLTTGRYQRTFATKTDLPKSRQIGFSIDRFLKRPQFAHKGNGLLQTHDRFGNAHLVASKADIQRPVLIVP